MLDVHFVFFWVWGGAQRETYLGHVWLSMLGGAEYSRKIADGLINEAPSFQN
jgi:hypothetical protein